MSATATQGDGARCNPPEALHGARELGAIATYGNGARCNGALVLGGLGSERDLASAAGELGTFEMVASAGPSPMIAAAVGAPPGGDGARDERLIDCRRRLRWRARRADARAHSRAATQRRR